LLLLSFQGKIFSQSNILHNPEVSSTKQNIAGQQLAVDPEYIEVYDVRGYKSLVLIPSNTSEAINGKLPTILFLHGIGERGNNLSNLKQKGFPRNLEGDKQFPFIFVMPQCPSSTEWYYTNADNVSDMGMFLDDIIARFPIDPDRLYITGLSMGGIGSWYFAIKLPSRFAALVPVSFRGDGWSPEPAKDIPVWAFHGAKDGVIPLTKAQELVNQFNLVGGSIRFDPYPNGGHDASTWTVTYNNPDVYEWMLRYKKVTHPTSTDYSGISMPEGFSLLQNYPNPFNPTTTISFDLPEASRVSLKIYDMLQREVATLINNDVSAGFHSFQWNAAGLSSGVYLYRITAVAVKGNMQQQFTQVKKLMLQK
jgi:pimeloyl-ACP methyl ester carboxylesterase